MNDENNPMPMDADLDLLESHLDGALPPDEAAALGVRLSADAELAATLDELRSQRADRSAVWAALEPGDRAVEQLCWRVRGAVAAERNPPGVRRPHWASFRPDPWRVARFTSAAAACVLLGFFGGRLGRGPASQSPVAQAVVQPAPGFTPVASADGSVEVPITDEYGRLVASQRFQNADQARRFLEDLHSAHDPAAGPAGEGSTRLASELRY